MTLFLFPGWPKVKVLAKPVHEILPLIFLIMNSYLLPIIISCTVYVKLISAKKRLFLNEVLPEISTILEEKNNAKIQQKTKLFKFTDSNPQFNSNCSNYSDTIVANHEEQNISSSIINVCEVQDKEVTIQKSLR